MVLLDVKQQDDKLRLVKFLLGLKIFQHRIVKHCRTA